MRRLRRHVRHHYKSGACELRAVQLHGPAPVLAAVYCPISLAVGAGNHDGDAVRDMFVVPKL